MRNFLNRRHIERNLARNCFDIFIILTAVRHLDCNFALYMNLISTLRRTHDDRFSLEATWREVSNLIKETEEGRRRVRKTGAHGEALFADTTPEGRLIIRERINK